MNVIVKKESDSQYLSYKEIKHFKYKSIGYYLYVFKWKLKGYEVEELEEL
jgi:hypothetical protein